MNYFREMDFLCEILQALVVLAALCLILVSSFTLELILCLLRPAKLFLTLASVPHCEAKAAEIFFTD